MKRFPMAAWISGEISNVEESGNSSADPAQSAPTDS